MLIELHSKVQLLTDEDFKFSRRRKEINTKALGSLFLEEEHRIINEKYAEGETRIITEQARYPLHTIVSTIVDNPSYKLNPEFQRRHRWSIEKQSRLIESFIMNVPIPPIFLYEVDYSEYEVMDGLQRLTAIARFYKDEVRLSGLTEWKELNGMTYSELPRQIKKGIDRRYLSSIVLLQETAKDKEEAQRLKQMVFERLNSGGAKLNGQEIRNALYNGELNQLCLKLAENEYFRKIWDIPVKKENESENKFEERLSQNNYYKEMQDVELVLRFFAYRHIEKTGNAVIENALDDFLEQGNKFDKSILESYEKIFNKTIELVYNVLGKDALKHTRKKEHRWDKDDYWIRHKTPSKVIYDPLMYTFQQYANNPQKQQLIDKNKEIKVAIGDFYKENDEAFKGRNSTKKDIIIRINLFKEFFDKYITTPTE